jgi:hypothetical protein
MLLYIVILVGLLITGGIVYLRLRDNYNMIPNLVIMAVGIGIACATVYFTRESQIKVPEILHYQYLRMTYYEPWNEYIHKTCSQEHCSGTGKDRSCYTTYYDCSYVEEHSEYWEALDNAGNERSVSRSEFEQAKNLWANNTFMDMHRDYHTKDGDAYTTRMPDSAMQPMSPRILGYSKEGRYRNKVVFSKSVFKFKDIQPDEDSTYGLYAWNGSPLMGSGNQIVLNLLNNANYLYGFRDQVSLRLLVFKNKPELAGFLQESKWNGGNKNEFNVCVGVDNQNEIGWVKVISWTTNEKLKLEVRDSIYSMKKLNEVDVAKYLVSYVPQKYVRREFKEFEYLPTPESPWLYVLGIGIVLVFGVICVFVRVD